MRKTHAVEDRHTLIFDDGTVTHVPGEDNTLDCNQRKGGGAGVDGSVLTQTVTLFVPTIGATSKLPTAGMI
jgi:hypothetical protein